MEKRTTAPEDMDANPDLSPMPEQLQAVLARVRGPKARKALMRDFAVLARETDRVKREQRQWMLFGALRYAWQLGQIGNEDYDILTDFSRWQSHD